MDGWMDYVNVNLSVRIIIITFLDTIILQIAQASTCKLLIGKELIRLSCNRHGDHAYTLFPQILSTPANTSSGN